MDEAKTEYEGAMNKLVDGKGNLITSVQKLKIMGAKAKKSLPDAILNRANSSLENLDEEQSNGNLMIFIFATLKTYKF